MLSVVTPTRSGSVRLPALVDSLLRQDLEEPWEWIVVPAARPSDDLEPLDYQRQPIPYGVLTHLDGTSSTLVEMARSQARLLFFLNTHCGSCIRIGEKLDGWADRLDPAVGVLAVYVDETAAQQSGLRPDLTAWEPDLNVRRVFSVRAPSAVLLGADGLLAGGPVAGEMDVVEFVDEVFLELTASAVRSGPAASETEHADGSRG